MVEQACRIGDRVSVVFEARVLCVRTDGKLMYLVAGSDFGVEWVPTEAVKSNDSQK